MIQNFTDNKLTNITINTMKIDKRQKEYDKLLKKFDDLNREAKKTKQRLQQLRTEMRVNPILVEERPDEEILKQ